MTGCNREGGKGRNEGSPPRPSVPPKLASLASFPEPPPERTAVLPSKTRFTTKTGILCFLSRNPPPLPPPPKDSCFALQGPLYAKTGVLCFLSRTPPPKGQLFCPPRPSVRPKLASFASFPQPPPPKGQLFCPPKPSIRPKLASFASFPEPPPQRTAVLPSKALCTTKTGVLCFLSRNPPPPKGQLFCPPRPSIRPKLASFASFPEPPPKGQLFCPPRVSVRPEVLCFLARTPPHPKDSCFALHCFLSRTPPHPKDSCFALQGSLYDQKSFASFPEPPPHPKDSCFALQGPLYHQNWRPLLPPFLKLPKPDPPPPERPEPEAALCCYRRAAGQSQNTAVSS